ncbi:MAG: SRPBCC family protein [Flavobacteriales bacterium]|nr:SRPBCC family protein [Flavobacteriales bacterium]
MAVHVFNREQLLEGVSLEAAWHFFSSPRNLKRITPAYMGFDIISDSNSEEMYPGQIIRYIVKPIAGISMNWTTEITQVQPPFFFIDEQRQGPYNLWHHQHKFKEVSNGVLMEDIVHYQAPFGFLGDIANKFMIRKKLNEIFDFRRKVIADLFSNG